MLVIFLLAGSGVALLASGGIIAVLNQIATDKEGYSLSNPYHVKSSTYAFMLGLSPDSDPQDTALTKWVVTSTNSNKELFVGWAWISNAEKYVSGMQFESPYPGYHWDYGPYSSMLNISTTQAWPGGAPSILPTKENFWIDSAQTNGSATVHYERNWDNSTLGDKALIIMNSDGAPNVQADIQLGTKVPILGWLPIVMIPLGLVLCIAGALLFLRKRK